MQVVGCLTFYLIFLHGIKMKIISVFMKTASWNRRLLEKVNSSSATQKISHFVYPRTFMEAEVSLPRYQKTIIQTNSDPHESSLHPLTLKINVNIIFPTKQRSCKRCFSFQVFPTNICYSFLTPTICSMKSQILFMLFQKHTRGIILFNTWHHTL